jgi:hypothetical protein
MTKAMKGVMRMVEIKENDKAAIFAGLLAMALGKRIEELK